MCFLKALQDAAEGCNVFSESIASAAQGCNMVYSGHSSSEPYIPDQTTNFRLLVSRMAMLRRVNLLSKPWLMINRNVNCYVLTCYMKIAACNMSPATCNGVLFSALREKLQGYELSRVVMTETE